MGFIIDMENLEPRREMPGGQKSTKNEPEITTRASRYKARQKRGALKDVQTKDQEAA